MKTRVTNKSRGWLAALFAAICTACGSAPPKPPFEVPFSLGKGGETVEFDFRVNETRGYVVGLVFYFPESGPNKSSKAREALMGQLTGGVSADGSVSYVKVPITLRITLKSIAVQGGPVEFDHITDQLFRSGIMHDSVEQQVQMRLNDKELEPGTYRLRVENIHPVPQFAGHRVALIIRQVYQGK